MALARSTRTTEWEAIKYYFSFHHVTALFSLGLLALLVVLNFAFDLRQSALAATPGLTWLAILSVVTLMTACVFDRYAKYAVASLYILGLLACAFVLQQLNLSPSRLAWSATLILSAYSLCAALVWHWRKRLISFATGLHVPERMKADATQLQWLNAFTVAAILATGILAYWISLDFFDFGLRVTAALALVAQCNPWFVS